MRKILMIYIEPTPYIVGLIENIILLFNGRIDVVFLEENLSQNWNISLDKQWMISPKGKLKSARFIMRLLLDNRYDMIHLAGWGEPISLLLIFFARFFSIPIVIESDTPMPHGTKLWKRVIKRLLYPRLFGLVSLFLPGGARQAQYIEYYGVSPERVIPVQMTVDVTSIRKYAVTLAPEDRQKTRERYSLTDKDIVFLFIGRLVEHKGIADLLTVFNRIHHTNVKLLLAGDGPMRQQVEESVKLNNHVRYAGRVSGNDLIKIYHAVDVMVLPSHAEPWGLVVNEAMTLGLPVIVSDRVGCTDDLVIHQKTGLIVKAGCIADLQSAIEELAIASETRASMSSQAVKIIEKWTLENEAEKICQAWSSLICV
ncbi:MAG: hypothetical protein A3F11_03160 [Gammaproteobacteria bacterium RIFCSPHIGHO2_12_FULL_37_14]|nr:MAG: hypothetical protein A3F11_03160 [Gammaproteobacteria bacterium RIFCSPHIGHO2_12_FULL_37_14]